MSVYFPSTKLKTVAVFSRKYIGYRIARELYQYIEIYYLL
jgi:hypothetical protein